MTSAQASQSIIPKFPKNIDDCSSRGAVTVGLSGFAYGIYEGIKVTGCAASGCSLCCVETCCACTYKSLCCFGIAAVGYGAGHMVGAAAGAALGYCSSDANDRAACLKALVAPYSTSRNTVENNVPSHSVEPVEAVNPGTTPAHPHRNEPGIVTSQPTTRYSEIINGTGSSASHLTPEVQSTSAATAINNGNGRGGARDRDAGNDAGNSGAGDDQVALPYFAPPPYESSVGPPPNYDDTRYHRVIPTTKQPEH